MLEAFNERFMPDGLEALKSAMRQWAIAVGGRFSDATVAACAVESVRRVVEERISESPK